MPGPRAPFCVLALTGAHARCAAPEHGNALRGVFMSKELVISATQHETRVAIMEDGQLCEIYIEREKEFALVGSLYKGRVTRVLPGMQSAFVDIGLDSDAFLYVSDFLEHLEEYDHVEPKAARPQARPNEVYPPTTNGGVAPAAAPVAFSEPVETYAPV